MALASCPICNQSFPQNLIEKHVNDCLDQPTSTPITLPSKPSLPTTTIPEQSLYFQQPLVSNSKGKGKMSEEEKEYYLLMKQGTVGKYTYHDEEDDSSFYQDWNANLYPYSAIQTNDSKLDEELARKLQEEEESIHSFKQQSLPSPNDISCDHCNASIPLDQIIFMEQCIHKICAECLKNAITTHCKKHKSIQDIKCLQCNCIIAQDNIKMVISDEEYNRMLDQSLGAFLEDEIFVSCVNSQCQAKWITEQFSRDQIIAQLLKQKVEPNEAQIHKQMYRFRCRECNTEFCSYCKASPYHEGKTCEQFFDLQHSKCCRFCGTKLLTTEEKQFLICNSNPECQAKKLFANTCTLPCGHVSCGIKNETTPLPCLQPECMHKGNQNANDLCNICYVEALEQAPCVQLECGHIFHYECIKKKVENKWTGARITFGFCNCPLCKQLIQHPDLQSILEPMYNLKKQVEQMCLVRLKHEQLQQHEDIVKQGGKYFNNPIGFGLDNFAYYPCYECKKPYFGGMRRCDQNLGDGNMNFKPEELVCGSCVSKKLQGSKSCEKHGTEFITYKCKFCCDVATWFCWGNTHFCDRCHTQQVKDQSVTKTPLEKLPKCSGESCPSGGKHPQNGTEEYAIGCSICLKNPSAEY